MKVNQIKSKVDKKIKKAGKADRKTGKKCGSIVAFIAIAATLCGCMHPEGQPSRSQTQNNDFSHCIVIVAARCGVTNEAVVAESADSIMPIELFTQTMKNEGSERNSPTMSPTQTTDLKPEVAVGVGGSSAGVGSSGAAKSGVGAAIGAAVDAAAGLFNGEGDGGKAETVTPTTMGAKTDSGSDTPCADGNCSDCEGGVCSD